jgi:hypothetical protein
MHMSDILKGNFKTKHEVKPGDAETPSLETQFEKAALKKLGGSIAFVSKKKVKWDEEPGDDKAD